MPSADAVGSAPSLTIDVDGIPYVAHRNATSSNLVITRCDDVTCSAAQTWTIDGGTDVGETPAMTIGGDGHLIVAHRAVTDTDLRVTKAWHTAWTTSAWDS